MPKPDLQTPQPATAEERRALVPDEAPAVPPREEIEALSKRYEDLVTDLLNNMPDTPLRERVLRHLKESNTAMLALSGKIDRDQLTNLFSLEKGVYEYQKLREVLPSRIDYSTALIMVDLDGFKAINDNFSHDIGDLCLQAFAKALITSTQNRAHQFAVRPHGDEFIIVLGSIPTAEASMVGQRFHEQVTKAFKSNIIELEKELKAKNQIKTNHKLPITASMGMATVDHTSFTGTESEFQRLKQIADLKCNEAKRSGKAMLVI
jgi:diguanylate cyclase (GGDEF)-like protein